MYLAAASLQTWHFKDPLFFLLTLTPIKPSGTCPGNVLTRDQGDSLRLLRQSARRGQTGDRGRPGRRSLAEPRCRPSPEDTRPSPVRGIVPLGCACPSPAHPSPARRSAETGVGLQSSSSGSGSSASPCGFPAPYHPPALACAHSQGPEPHRDSVPGFHTSPAFMKVSPPPDFTSLRVGFAAGGGEPRGLTLTLQERPSGGGGGPGQLAGNSA